MDHIRCRSRFRDSDLVQTVEIFRTHRPIVTLVRTLQSRVEQERPIPPIVYRTPSPFGDLRKNYILTILG